MKRRICLFFLSAFFNQAFAETGSRTFECLSNAPYSGVKSNTEPVHGSMSFTISTTDLQIVFHDASIFIHAHLEAETPYEMERKGLFSIEWINPWYFTAQGNMTFEKPVLHFKTGDVTPVLIEYDDDDGFFMPEQVFECLVL